MWGEVWRIFARLHGENMNGLGGVKAQACGPKHIKQMQQNRKDPAKRDGNYQEFPKQKQIISRQPQFSVSLRLGVPHCFFLARA